jgi:streptogramin lyase
VTEFSLSYPSAPTPSTHELTPDPSAPNTYWVTGPAHNALVRFDVNTGQATHFPLGDRTAPHGIVFDNQGRLWVTLEGKDQARHHPSAPRTKGNFRAGVVG